MLYEGRIIRVKKDTVRLENDATATREVVMHHGGVCILPLTDAGEVLLVRQFRYPYGQVVVEAPAGKLEPGEDPLECGKRELLEETGMAASDYRFLGELYPSPGYCDEVISLYLATGLTEKAQQLDEDEFLEVDRVPLDTAVEQILSGEIKDSKTQAVVLKTKLLLGK